MDATFLDLYFRHRSTALLLLAFPVAAWALDARAGTSALAAGSGILAVAAGVALRLVAARRIGRGARVYRAHASAGLIASGPYRWTRNPLYIAAVLMLFGFELLAGGGVWAAALVPAALVVYTPVIAAEERALGGILGTPYARYRERVPRWIGLRGPRPSDPADEQPVPWREVLRREVSLVPGVVLGVAAVLAIGSLGLGLPASWLAAGWLLAACWNSLHVDRKRRRRARRQAERPT